MLDAMYSTDLNIISLDEGSAPVDPTYIIDLNTISLDDVQADQPMWIQAMPLGTYKHPVHGDINFTPDRVQEFADNVKNGIRGQDLDIDYDHKALSGEASGWIVDAQARLNESDAKRNGLWLAVKWTGDALTKIKSKAYRYFSPEFVNTWTHPKTNVEHKNVLFGGALTNRPFLKDILPVNLSEVIIESGGSMDRAKMLQLLGLKDDASDADIEAAVETLKNPPAPEPTDEGSDKGAPAEPVVPVAASEDDADLIKLAESNPAIKVLLDERKATAERIALLEVANRQQSVAVKLSEIANDDKAKVVLAPAVMAKAKNLALAMPVSLSDQFYDLLSDFSKQSFVQLGESGHSKPGGEGDVIKQFTDKVDALVTAGMDYRDASQSVSLSDPELFDAYRRESTTRERV